MGAQHLPTSGASEHIPSSTELFNEKDVKEKESEEAETRIQVEVEATLNAQETGLQFLLFSPGTQGHRSAGASGYVGDLESFATASSLAPATIEQAYKDREIQPDRRGNRSKSRKIRFQDLQVGDGEVGALASGAHQSLLDNEIDKSRGKTVALHEGPRLQQKAGFPSGQDILSDRDSGIIEGGTGRREGSMERRHISGSDSMMIVGVRANDAPPYQSGILGLNSNTKKEEMMDVDESMDSADVNANTTQVQQGESARTNRISRSFSETAIEVPNPALVPTRAPSSTPTLTENWQSTRNSKAAHTRTMTEPLSTHSAPLPSFPQAPVTQPISCECGRVIDLPLPIVTSAAAAHFQDSRQRQFTYDEPMGSIQTSTRPLSMTSSYFAPLSSFMPPSYQASFISWRDSIIAPSYASLLSSHINIDNDDDDEDDEEVAGIRDGPVAGVQETLNPPKERRFPALGHSNYNHSHTGSHGVAATAERLASLVMSTGQATLGYVKDAVVPTAIHLAHRSASSTIGFLTSHIPDPSSVPSMLPRFLGDMITGRQGATNEHGTNHQGAGGTPERRWSRSTTDSRGLGDRMSRSASELVNTRPSLPEAVYHRTRRSSHLSSSSTSPSKTRTSITTPATISTALMPTNRLKRARRSTLQTIPGPEGLDPETRRRLEAQGLAALGLRDESAGQGWRSWWDPRRYGLPKYIICHEIRTPRPCTTILLLILIVCIVLPVVFRRK
ncbi:hypothetical protein BG015_008842 [Linnemannia schmuckeri]|uniref:Uncharacterized protein n=1 Tax=Linnemannia schmuckeri TaxID=64567 RepID=A0A9P5VA89_9FUNG|nr:hypothetical protein BG015_008842 [Linnemannia schmuckeri]